MSGRRAAKFAECAYAAIDYIIGNPWVDIDAAGYHVLVFDSSRKRLKTYYRWVWEIEKFYGGSFPVSFHWPSQMHECTVDDRIMALLFFAEAYPDVLINNELPWGI